MGGPTCVQGARFHTPSDTVVRSYHVARKPRKNRKPHFAFCGNQTIGKLKSKEPNKKLGRRIRSNKKVNHFKKSIQSNRKWNKSERHSHESEDDGSLLGPMCDGWSYSWPGTRREVEYMLLFLVITLHASHYEKSSVSTAILLPIFPSFLFLFQTEDDPFPRCRTR